MAARGWRESRRVPLAADNSDRSKTGMRFSPHLEEAMSWSHRFFTTACWLADGSPSSYISAGQAKRDPYHRARHAHQAKRKRSTEPKAFEGLSTSLTVLW